MHDTIHAEEVRKHIRVYLIIFASLAVLTGVTVGVAYLDLPMTGAIVVALMIATLKAGLVAGYFMHLISEKRLILSLVLSTMGLFITMLLLFTVYHYDFETYLVP